MAKIYFFTSLVIWLSGCGGIGVNPFAEPKKQPIQTVHDDKKRLTLLRVNENYCESGGALLQVDPALATFDNGKKDLRILISDGVEGSHSEFAYRSLSQERSKPIVFTVDKKEYAFALSPPDEPIRRASMTGAIIEPEWIVSGVDIDFFKALILSKKSTLDVYGQKAFGIEPVMHCELGSENKALIEKFIATLDK